MDCKKAGAVAGSEALLFIVSYKSEIIPQKVGRSRAAVGGLWAAERTANNGSDVACKAAGKSEPIIGEITATRDGRLTTTRVNCLRMKLPENEGCLLQNKHATSANQFADPDATKYIHFFKSQNRVVYKIHIYMPSNWNDDESK